MASWWEVEKLLVYPSVPLLSLSHSKPEGLTAARKTANPIQVLRTYIQFKSLFRDLPTQEGLLRNFSQVYVLGLRYVTIPEEGS